MTTLPDIPLVYLNGEFVPPAKATISAFDRGFIFGDGVYEVIPVFGGRLFRLAHHLDRLDNSLREIRLANPYGSAEWRKIFERLIAGIGMVDQSIYLQVTRGVAPRDHAFPPGAISTVFAYGQKLKYPPPEQLATGVSAVTASDIRWNRCDIKAIALLANALLRQQAAERGAAEAILVRNGIVTEGAASNLFLVKRGTVITPPKGPFILPGITRDLVLELTGANGIASEERNIEEDELYHADELWMTSSTKEILPITHLNDRAVGTGKPGPLHARVFALYKNYKKAFCAGQVE